MASRRGQEAPPPKQGVIPPHMMAGLVLVVVVAGVFAIAMMIQPPKEEAVEEPVKQVVDPFADLGDELPISMQRRRDAEQQANQAAPAATNLLAVFDDAEWEKAVSAAEEAGSLFEAAQNARANEELAEFREKAQQAQDKYAQAVEIADRLRPSLEKGSAAARAFEGAYSQWMERLLVLKKGVR